MLYPCIVVQVVHCWQLGLEAVIVLEQFQVRVIVQSQVLLAGCMLLPMLWKHCIAFSCGSFCGRDDQSVLLDTIQPGVINLRSQGDNSLRVCLPLQELEVVLAVAAARGVRPLLGVRAKLSTRHGGHWGATSGEHAKFGLRPREIVGVVHRLAAAGLLDCLQLLHFHIGSQVEAPSGCDLFFFCMPSGCGQPAFTNKHSTVPTWCQLLQEAKNRPVEVLTMTEALCQGALLCPCYVDNLIYVTILHRSPTSALSKKPWRRGRTCLPSWRRWARACASSTAAAAWALTTTALPRTRRPPSRTPCRCAVMSTVKSTCWPFGTHTKEAMRVTRLLAQDVVRRTTCMRDPFYILSQ